MRALRFLRGGMTAWAPRFDADLGGLAIMNIARRQEQDTRPSFAAADGVELGLAGKAKRRGTRRAGD